MNLRRRPGSRGGEFHLARVRGRPSECLAMDLEGLLGELRREGSVDSEGRFTINPLQARQKLQRYQLADPHDYVLLLVSAAIAGGASWLEVQANHERCQLRFDGHHYSCDEMRELFAIALMADLQLRHLSDLALGLNAALLLEPRWVRVQSWDGQAGASLELSQSRFQVNDLSQSFWERPTALNQISVVRPPRSVMNRLRGLAGVAPEHRALEARCCFAPIPIAVNGRSLEQPVPLDECVAVMLCGQPEVRHPALVEIRENHAGLSCALGLGPWRLQVILDGVAFGEPEVWLPAPLAGVIHCGGLQKDLSGLGLVQNAEYERLGQLLLWVAERLLDELSQALHRLPEAQTKQALEILLEAGERLRSAERLEQAQTLLQRCLEASQREWDLRLVEVRSLYLLGCVQRRLGKEEKADVYFERGLEVCLQTMRLAPALRYDLSRWGLALVEAGSAGPTVLCDWSLFAGAEALEAELWPQARELFEQAWELSEQSRGAAKRGAAATLGLALAYEHVGELEQAASCARRALAFAEQDDPSLASRSDEFYGEARAQHRALLLEPFLLRLFHLEKQLGNSDQARRLLGRMVMLKTGDMATLLSQARTELTHIREVAAWGCPDLVGVLHPRA